MSRSTLVIPLIVGGAQFMHQFDGAVIATALPSMAASLHEDPVRLNLAITTYLLALAVFVPVSGWMADRFGAKRVFMSAIVVFTVSSVLCGIRAFAARARPLSHPAGHRRRHDDAGRARDRAQERAQAAARAGDELHHHSGGAGAAIGALGRRLHRHLFLLAVDFLHQSADRLRRHLHGALLHSRCCGRKGRAVRPARLRADRHGGRRSGVRIRGDRAGRAAGPGHPGVARGRRASAAASI